MRLESLPSRRLGIFGPSVGVLGLGARQLGEAAVQESDVGRLINSALDSGAVLFDAARGYDLSELRLGRHLGKRRQEAVLSTKVGYGVEGCEDWSSAAVSRGIDESLRRMQTDYLDVVYLHSCSIEVLEHGEALEAIERAQVQGKVRCIGYSGENQALEFAVRSGRFQVVEVSINLFDQRCIETSVAEAASRGLGVVAKRPTGNAPWRFETRPVGWYCEPYWERMHEMRLRPDPLAWRELALQFVAAVPGVSSLVVGTGNPDHFLENLAAIGGGPLPASIYDRCRAAFAAADNNWVGQI